MGEIEFGGVDDPSVGAVGESSATADRGVLEITAADKDEFGHLIGVDGVDVEGDQAFGGFHDEIGAVSDGLLEGLVGGEHKSVGRGFVGSMGLEGREADDRKERFIVPMEGELSVGVVGSDGFLGGDDIADSAGGDEEVAAVARKVAPKEVCGGDGEVDGKGASTEFLAVVVKGGVKDLEMFADLHKAHACGKRACALGKFFFEQKANDAIFIECIVSLEKALSAGFFLEAWPVQSASVVFDGEDQQAVRVVGAALCDMGVYTERSDRRLVGALAFFGGFDPVFDGVA